MSMRGDDPNFFDTITLASADGMTVVKFRGGMAYTEIRCGEIVVMETVATGEWYKPPGDCGPPEPSAP